MAYVRAILISLSILTLIVGMVFPPLHIVSVVLMVITGFVLLVNALDAAAHRPRPPK